VLQKFTYHRDKHSEVSKQLQKESDRFHSGHIWFSM